MKIYQKLSLGFIVLTLSVVVLGFTAFKSSQNSLKTFAGLEGNFAPFTKMATKITSYSKRAESHLFLFLMLGDPADRDKFFSRVEALKNEIVSIRKYSVLQNQFEIIEQMTLETDILLKLGEALLTEYGDDAKKFRFKDHKTLIANFHQSSSSIRNNGVKLGKISRNLFLVKQAIDLNIDIISYSKRAEGHLFKYLMLGEDVDRDKFFLRVQSLKSRIDILNNILTSLRYKNFVMLMRTEVTEITELAKALLAEHDKDPKNFNPKDHENNIKKFHKAISLVRGYSMEVANLKALQVNDQVNEVVATIKFNQLLIIIYVLVFLFLSIGLAMYIFIYVTSPIKKINKATQKITAGHLDTKIEINSRDEIGELAKSLNKMVGDLVLAQKGAQAATDAKSNFLARMSHEIRTPMNAIIGLSELAMMTHLSPKQQDYLNKIDSASHNLLGVINDILDFSKIEAGKLTIESIDFNLQEVFDNLSTLLTFQAEEKGLDLLFLISPDVPLCLKGDPLRLGQILTNLSNNAIKFTEKGEILVTVFIEKKEPDNELMLRFSVEDRGIGIAQENIEKLFQPFSQTDVSTTRKSGGTGLGLVISKSLVNIMHGDIWVESIIGKGSAFIFTARFGKLPPGKRVEGKHKRLRDGIEEIKDLADIRGAKVLLVEDNEMNQLVAKELLEQIGIVVTIANNGKKGVEKIKKTNFDLALMDIQMPEMDGYEATRKIRKDARFIDLPIIAMTAQALPLDREKCLQAGMNDYISKPINSHILFSKLAEWIKPGEREAAVGSVEEKPNPEQEVVLPELSDIDVKSALELIGGNRALYKNLLLKFQSDYSNASKEITEELKEGKLEEAERLAHTIKGIAGTIGAVSLQKSAGVLERGIKERESAQYQGLLEDFEKNLGKALDSLKAIKPVEEKRASKKGNSRVIKPKLLINLLKNLEPHLKSHKPKKCAPLMDELLNLSWPEGLDKDIDDLRELIGKYKFKEAQALVRDTMRKLV